ADTEGGIGYMLQQVLGNALTARGITRTVVTVITQVLVDAADPAFSNPTKPIGPFFDRDDAEERMRKRGWRMVEERGRGWRRVVPSPKPQRILELAAIERLTGGGLIPIAAGGGGVPVVERNGQLFGVEAVVDKDLASAMLARALGAELLLISTGVDHVQTDFATPKARDLHAVTSASLRGLWQSGAFAPGSMGPKIESALEFLDAGGRKVIITSPGLITRALAGQAGTLITP
ncbi:MAG: carbamate kinase, partial [Deltaproteobacteria bacterium]|nr:carbamate kinase [Deltaproteobacteria bacterium]